MCLPSTPSCCHSMPSAVLLLINCPTYRNILTSISCIQSVIKFLYSLRDIVFFPNYSVFLIEKFCFSSMQVYVCVSCVSSECSLCVLCVLYVCSLCPYFWPKYYIFTTRWTKLLLVHCTHLLRFFLREKSLHMTCLDMCHSIHQVCVRTYLVFIYVYISSNIYVSAFVLHNITIIVIHLYSNNFAYSISFFWIVFLFLLNSSMLIFLSSSRLSSPYLQFHALVNLTFIFCCQLYNLTV